MYRPSTSLIVSRLESFITSFEVCVGRILMFLAPGQIFYLRHFNLWNLKLGVAYLASVLNEQWKHTGNSDHYPYLWFCFFSCLQSVSVFYVVYYQISSHHNSLLLTVRQIPSDTHFIFVYLFPVCVTNYFHDPFLLTCSSYTLIHTLCCYGSFHHLLFLHSVFYHSSWILIYIFYTKQAIFDEHSKLSIQRRDYQGSRIQWNFNSPDIVSILGRYIHMFPTYNPYFCIYITDVKDTEFHLIQKRVVSTTIKRKPGSTAMNR